MPTPTPIQSRFAEFLSQCWMGEFRHGYKISSQAAWSPWRARVGPTPEWWCSSLREASLHYSWPENDRNGSFSKLAARLRAALTRGDDAEAKEACIDIFRWGGVARKANDASRLWVLRAALDASLVRRICDAAAMLAPGSDLPLNRFDGADLLMNSAMTKVYTAASSAGNVVMYDGRVGAALGLLARRFLERCGVPEVPDDLAFRWGAPTTRSASKARTRDPSLGTHRFLALPNTSSHSHADLIRADIARVTGVVLKDVIRLLSARGIAATTSELERALFMVGFDVRPRNACTDSEASAQDG